MSVVHHATRLRKLKKDRGMLRNSEKSWGWVSILFHWLIALVVLGLFFLGLWMVELTYYDDWYRYAPYIHKSVGISLFLFVLLNLLWKTINTKPASILTHSDFEKRASRIAHASLHILLVLIMLSGYLISTADGRPIDVFGLVEIPAMISGVDKQEDIAGIIHLTLAISLMVVVVVHAGGALKHHYIDKDSTLKRMLGIH